MECVPHVWLCLFMTYSLHFNLLSHTTTTDNKRASYLDGRMAKANCENSQIRQRLFQSVFFSSDIRIDCNFWACKNQTATGQCSALPCQGKDRQRMVCSTLHNNTFLTFYAGTLPIDDLTPQEFPDFYLEFFDSAYPVSGVLIVLDFAQMNNFSGWSNLIKK